MFSDTTKRWCIHDNNDDSQPLAGVLRHVKCAIERDFQLDHAADLVITPCKFVDTGTTYNTVDPANAGQSWSEIVSQDEQLEFSTLEAKHEPLT